MVESIPLRVRRVRVAPVEEPPTRIRRTRGSAIPPTNTRERFHIDWDRSLGWKLQIYLVSSYLYYQLNRSIITDHDFDRLCNELYAGWGTFTHQHKHCTTRGDMRAGTGYANEYPPMVRGAAEYMLTQFVEL